MRVISGTARGRRLVAPTGLDVRPSTDRVREATFNALGSLGVLSGATVLDLFAGSGALGIEALSRGAARAHFVDASPAALAAVRTNLAALELEQHAHVERADALEFVQRMQPVDVALLDPPYAFDRWPELLRALDAAVLVIESDREVELDDRLDVVRRRRYGGTVVTIARTPDRDEHGRPDPEDRS